MNRQEDGSFVVVSDFHSNRWPVDEKIPKYLKEYDVIYILGDATDRGNDERGNVLSGDGGIQLLLDIMDLCKKHKGRIVYIPGNHDELLYNYAAHRETELGATMGQHLAHPGVKGAETVKDIDNLRKENPHRFYELIEWLGSLPIQRKHTHKGKTYSLAHAFFNQQIYEQDPNYSLESLFSDIILKYHGIYNANYKETQILWFRKGNKDYYSPEDVPTDSVEIIGHTPIQQRNGLNLDLKNSNGGITRVICVDGGIAYQQKSNEMLKYVGGNDRAVNTVTTYDIKRSDQDETPIQSNKDIRFINAVAATIENLGIDQARWLITEWIFKDKPNWYLTFSEDQRSLIEDIKLEEAKEIILSYSSSKSSNPEIIAYEFIKEIIKKYGLNIQTMNRTKESLIDESLELLGQIATTEEQHIIIKHQEKEYTLRDYVQYVMPDYYLDNQLIIKTNGSFISFTDFIEGILNQYRKKIESSESDERRKRKA